MSILSIVPPFITYVGTYITDMYILVCKSAPFRRNQGQPWNDEVYGRKHDISKIGIMLGYYISNYYIT